MEYKILTFLVAFSFMIISCGKKPGEGSSLYQEENDTFNYSGETLSRMYCGSCHAYAEPGLLDKKTWENGTLPQMGFRMGLYGETPRQSLIESGTGGKLVEQHNIFPLQPVIDEHQWKRIVQFYVDNAPDSLVLSSKDLKIGTGKVKVEIPEFHISPPMVTAIKYHPELEQLFVADAKADYSTINILDRKMRSVSTLAVPSPIADIAFKGDTILATLMGGFMPTDSPGGSIIKVFKLPGESEYKGFTTLLRDLQRPVCASYMDMNADNLEDIIVCEYGNHTGKLSLFINQKNGRYFRKILSPDPGAISVQVKDMNKDGLPDIIALMAQGNERIDIHYNLGNGNFSLKNLVKFPPSYGSMAISLIDWNKDGYEDIIYVNGDNADYSMIFKPYHGVRIFLNDSNDNFSEAFFQHINGAYKAIPYDFDGDGDIDIATISFFPDLHRTPEEGFVFMENKGLEDSIRFELQSLDQAARGRWITAEAADIDKDGTKELILGAFTGMAIQEDTSGKLGGHLIDNSPTLMVLKFHQNH